MAHKNPFGISVETFERALLNGHDPETDRPWHIVVNDIGCFIIGAYELGFNPLPHLRKIFPGFTWEYHNINALSDNWRTIIAELIARSDFFWIATYGTEEHFVTARRKNTNDPTWKVMCLTEADYRQSHFYLETCGARDEHPLISQGGAG